MQFGALTEMVNFQKYPALLCCVEVRSASEAGLPVDEENPSKVDRILSPPKV